MNETLVTLQGWLGTDVTLRQAGETLVATFRVACTPRRYQKKTDRGSTAPPSGTPSTPGGRWPSTASARCAGATRWSCTAGSTPSSGRTRPAWR